VVVEVAEVKVVEYAITVALAVEALLKHFYLLPLVR
jgi:hypothetical protein